MFDVSSDLLQRLRGGKINFPLQQALEATESSSPKGDTISLVETQLSYCWIEIKANKNERVRARWRWWAPLRPSSSPPVPFSAPLREKELLV